MLVCRIAVESRYLRYVRGTKLIRRFPKALQLFKKLIEKATSEDSHATKDGIGAT